MASISMKMERGTGVYGISESEERGDGGWFTPRTDEI